MNTKYLPILLSGAATHLGAFAHEGHGMAGSAHWHATDALGFVGMVALVVLAWYLGKGK